MSVHKEVYSSLKKIFEYDKQKTLYLFYYSAIEAVLLLVVPLASSFIINSILAHATISIFVLGVIVVVIFILIILIQIVKQYIIEKFEQKIFIYTGIKIAQMATKISNVTDGTKDLVDKYMNYFFDIISIQKIFPMLLLDGSSLIVKLIVSLLLLLFFDVTFFVLGIFFLIFFGIVVYFLSSNSIKYAVERSNAKHDAIYYLQSIPYLQETQEKIFLDYDKYLKDFVYARRKIFSIVIRQLGLTFIMEGIIFSTFLILGGYHVVQGTIPIGEFVAAEIVVVSIISSLKGFMKQVDYIYDMIEGLYKVDKLELSLKENSNV